MPNRKTRIITDFDGVMFNTSLFRDLIFEVFIRTGYQMNDIKTTYMLESMDYKYSPLNHLDRLQKIKHTNQKLSEARIGNIYSHIPKYLYEDVQEFVSLVDRKKYELDILTLGDKEYQYKKIQQSGIVDSLDDVYITIESKQDYLEGIVKGREEFILIDDRADILETIRINFPKALCIQIIRQDLDISDAAKMYKDVYGGIKIKSLPEVFRYL